MLGCRDPKAMAEWFRDALGFDLGPDAFFEGVPGEGVVYAIADRDGMAMHFQIRRGVLRADRAQVETDCYVYVDDVDALHDECVAAGVTIFRELYDEPYGMRDFSILTPEDHRIAFGSTI